MGNSISLSAKTIVAGRIAAESMLDDPCHKFATSEPTPQFMRRHEGRDTAHDKQMRNCRELLHMAHTVKGHDSCLVLNRNLTPLNPPPTDPELVMMHLD